MAQSRANPFFEKSKDFPFSNRLCLSRTYEPAAVLTPGTAAGSPLKVWIF